MPSSLFTNVHAAMVRTGARIMSAGLSGLSAGDQAWLSRQLLHHRFAPETRRMARSFTNALAAWHNQQHDVHANGEVALLRRLAPFEPRVLFDVGANVGDWTLAGLDVLPAARIHAFEIDPSTAERLRERLGANIERTTVNACGLADIQGEALIEVAAFGTQTHLVHGGPDDRATGVTKACMVTTGDAYVTQAGIDRIDFVKIDVEGAEPRVLAGFESCFARGAVTMVQFEYTLANLQHRYFLTDFYRFFEERGFAVGKIYPEGVAFKPFEPADEDLRGPNFLACLRQRGDIIDALRCPVLTIA